MSKRVQAILILVVMLFSVYNAAAEDLSAMTEDALLELRLQINNELASRMQQDEAPEESSIADLFPDPVFAKYIRDQIGALSTKDAVTQDQLDSIYDVSFLSHDDGLTDLEGIQYLHNIEELYLYWQDGVKVIPDSIGTLENLEQISLTRCGISALPDSITNLSRLNYLRIDDTEVAELPEDIGNLEELTYLDISRTKITRLPESIRNLKLGTFLRDGLDID